MEEEEEEQPRDQNERECVVGFPLPLTVTLPLVVVVVVGWLLVDVIIDELAWTDWRHSSASVSREATSDFCHAAPLVFSFSSYPAVDVSWGGGS